MKTKLRTEPVRIFAKTQEVRKIVFNFLINSGFADCGDEWKLVKEDINSIFVNYVGSGENWKGKVTYATKDASGHLNCSWVKTFNADIQMGELVDFFSKVPPNNQIIFRAIEGDVTINKDGSISNIANKYLTGEEFDKLSTIRADFLQEWRTWEGK